MILCDCGDTIVRAALVDLGRDWAIFNFEGLRPSCLKMRRMGALILQVAW
jgi:hypothetical protein